MAEAIGLGASIAGLATFGAQIVTSLRTYASAYSRASQKINGLSSDLALINSILTDLGTSITKYEQKFNITSTNFVEAKASCERNFERLRKALKVVKKDETGEGDVKGKSLGKERSVGPWDKLMFALGGEEELKTFLQEIESSKSTLQLLLESFKLFILLRLHELNEEQREDIKLLNQKVPVLVMGIRRAGLGNLEPRQKQREQHFITEPTTVMHVSMPDGPADRPKGLFFDQPGTSGSLQETTSNRKARRGLPEQEDDPKTEAAPTSMTVNIPQVPETSNRGAPFQEGFALMSMMASAHQNDNDERGYVIGSSERSDHQQSTLGLLQEHNSSVNPSNEVQQGDPQFRGRLTNASEIKPSTSDDYIGNTTSNWNTTKSLISTQDDKSRGIPENSNNVPGVRASSNIKDPAPAVEFQHQLKHQNHHVPSHRHPIQTVLEENQDEAGTVSKDAKYWDEISNPLPQPATSYPKNPETFPSSSRNPEILPSVIYEVPQRIREISTEGGERPRIHPVVRDRAEPRNIAELSGSSPPTISSNSLRLSSVDDRSIYEGWLLETSSDLQNQPPFAIFCCSQSPLDYRPGTPPRWLISPFSRDTSILKRRIESPSQPPSDLISLPINARDEVSDLIRDRNDNAPRDHCWTLAAISSYSPIKNSGFSLRKRTREKERGKYLVILRGGPRSSPRGEAEDLPDRYSNPWPQRRLDRVASPYRINPNDRYYRGYDRVAMRPATPPLPPPRWSGRVASSRRDPRDEYDLERTTRKLESYKRTHTRDEYELERYRKELEAEKFHEVRSREEYELEKARNELEKYKLHSTKEDYELEKTRKELEAYKLEKEGGVEEKRIKEMELKRLVEKKKALERLKKEFEMSSAKYELEEAEKAAKWKKEKEEREKEYQHQLEDDLRKSGMSEQQISVVLKKDKGVDPNRQTYTRMSRMHLSIETLNKYRIEYELDQDPDYVLIKRWVPEYEQDFLWAHTKQIRERRRPPEQGTISPTNLLRRHTSADIRDAPDWHADASSSRAYKPSDEFRARPAIAGAALGASGAEIPAEHSRARNRSRNRDDDRSTGRDVMRERISEDQRRLVIIERREAFKSVDSASYPPTFRRENEPLPAGPLPLAIQPERYHPKGDRAIRAEIKALEAEREALRAEKRAERELHKADRIRRGGRVSETDLGLYEAERYERPEEEYTIMRREWIEEPEGDVRIEKDRKGKMMIGYGKQIGQGYEAGLGKLVDGNHTEKEATEPEFEVVTDTDGKEELIRGNEAGGGIEEDEELSESEARRIMSEFLKGFSADERGGLAPGALDAGHDASKMKENGDEDEDMNDDGEVEEKASS